MELIAWIFRLKIFLRRIIMDISRKLGIGVVMMIPGFVGSGLAWHLTSSWLLVFVWVAVMIGLYGFMFNKFGSDEGESHH